MNSQSVATAFLSNVSTHVISRQIRRLNDSTFHEKLVSVSKAELDAQLRLHNLQKRRTAKKPPDAAANV
jgi:hypothetical protein